jgi:CheY-like chemotaxis protein
MTPLQHHGETDPPRRVDADRPKEQKQCIALLDDNADIRRLVRTMLERDYIVEDFDNAMSLLEFLDRKPCDLIISDLSLPNMDRFDFIVALKKDSRLAGIPVVALTASGSDETRKRALAAGFIAYLVKPAPMYQLLSVIGQNLRKLP